HHVHHWADGGETSLDNLVLLCRYHHRLVHEAGFRCEATAEGDFRFLTPSGFPLPEAFPQKPGAWEAVTQLNAHRGLAITPRTCDGGWDGVPVDYGEAVAQVWRATKGTWDVPVAEVPLAEVPMPPPRFRGNVEASAPTDPESNPDPGDEVDDGLWWPVVNGRVLRSGDCPDRG
ncbi:MAG: HNH endonuclease signature motif containing protein, partial [Pseudomonadales bacterium]|nr:HNH endonuclease signature motif containing protein [Pseudomonadales bacterium]